MGSMFRRRRKPALADLVAEAEKLLAADGRDDRAVRRMLDLASELPTASMRELDAGAVTLDEARHAVELSSRLGEAAARATTSTGTTRGAPGRPSACPSCGHGRVWVGELRLPTRATEGAGLPVDAFICDACGHLDLRVPQVRSGVLRNDGFTPVESDAQTPGD